MGRIYDNWERLVTAVTRKEQLWQIAHTHSINSSIISSDDDFSFSDRFISSHLIDDPLPAIDDEDEGFYVDNGNENNYMVRAKELLILMRRKSQYWDWTTNADSRFSEVAILHYGRCLDIRGRIKTQMLSSDTTYVAYLVFKLTDWSKGFESANAIVNIFSVESDRDAQESAQIVHLRPVRNPIGPIPLRRIDGWMEVEIGQFFVDGCDEAVEARILELTSWKMGLIIEGIEFRPLFTESRFAFPQPVQLLLGETDESSDNNREIILKSSDLEKSPICVNEDVDMEVHEARAGEKDDETEIDISLLQKFAQISSDMGSDPSSRLQPSDQSKQKNDKTLQDDVIGEKMMPKLLVPKGETLLASLTRDELFSGGYECLSKVVYYFDGMKRMVEVKDKEIDDLKQKLCKYEVKAQLALAAKDSELEALKKMVSVLKSEIRKAQDKTREEVRKAGEKVKKAESEVENAEARAASAIEDYKNSHELKVEKHKFASKAFVIGFDVCKKQVLEVDPSFDMSRIDVKCLGASSSSPKI